MLQTFRSPLKRLPSRQSQREPRTRAHTVARFASSHSRQQPEPPDRRGNAAGAPTGAPRRRANPYALRQPAGRNFCDRRLAVPKTNRWRAVASHANETGLEVLTSLPYTPWRESDPEDTLRFHALRMHEVAWSASPTSW